MPAIGVDALGVEAIAGEYLWGQPVVSLTQPILITQSTGQTFTFSFTPFSGRPKVWHQYRISSLGGTVLETGPQDATVANQFTPSYIFSAGSAYRIAVRAYDGFEVSSWNEVSPVFTSLGGLPSYTPESRVGSTYEIGINGVGYMLSDDPQTPIQRQTAAVESPRLVTGDTPFAESFDRYSIGSFSANDGGAGQVYQHRPDSAPNRYWDSYNIDPFDPEGLRLLHAFSSVTTSGLGLFTGCASVGGFLWLPTSNTVLTKWNPSTNASTGTTATCPANILGVCTDGLYVYMAAADNKVYRFDVGTPGSVSVFATIPGTLQGQIEWVVDRVVVHYIDASNFRVISTLAPDGTEEVVGGRFSHTKQATVVSITGGDGYLWYAVTNGTSAGSQIHFWQIGSEDEYAASGLTLPNGEVPITIGYHLGNLFILTYARANTGHLYRCIPQDGVLTPELLVEFKDVSQADMLTASAQRAFASIGDKVYFPWVAPTKLNPASTGTKSRVGIISLATGGYCVGHRVPNPAGSTTSGDTISQMVAGPWGLAAIGRPASGPFNQWVSIESQTVYASTGTLVTSVADFESTLTKYIDQLDVRLAPLPSNTQATFTYSIDGGSTFISTGLTSLTQAGTRNGTWGPFGPADSITLGITLAATGGGNASTPTITITQVRTHVRPVSDQLIVFPIKVASISRGTNGRDIDRYASGRSRNAIEVVRHFESLMGQMVQLQDVDWPVTQTTSLWEVVGVEPRLVGAFDNRQNRRVDAGTILVTLRRSVS